MQSNPVMSTKLSGWESSWFPMFRSEALEMAVVGAATVMGLFLRMFDLGARALSSVEVYTWDFAHHPVSFIVGRLTHIETNPPLYYLIAHFVMQIGDSEFLLRLPSALAGTLAIPLVYVLGRLGGAPRSGIIGAGLLALSALAIDYSREARTYPLLQDACLIAAIGTVLIMNRWRASAQTSLVARRESLGWVLLSLAAIVGFYLHYTFLFEILALECAILASALMGWLRGNPRIDRSLLVRWAASCLAILVGASWGILLARELAHSENLAWITRPSLGDAVRLVIHTDGYGNFARLQPLPDLVLVGLALLGLAVGWRRSSAILAGGMLFILFPVILFAVSQNRPVLIERTLVAPCFAACLLAGQGVLFLAVKAAAVARRVLSPAAVARWGDRRIVAAVGSMVVILLFAPALVSAANTVRGGRNWEPYDQVAEYLASVVKPGDAAVGNDGVIYYRQRVGADFPLFKLVEGHAAEAEVTYGSPTVTDDGISRVAATGHSVYLVMRETNALVLDGEFYPSNADYVRKKLGIHEPPIELFGTLSVYRLPGACSGSVRCLSDASQ
jgi:4-amino-4-deoxy-L-arabinose transferase-like glycosyltransferase